MLQQGPGVRRAAGLGELLVGLVPLFLQPLLPVARSLLPGKPLLLPVALSLLPVQPLLLPGSLSLLPVQPLLLPVALSLLPVARSLLPVQPLLLPVQRWDGRKSADSEVIPLLRGWRSGALAASVDRA
ncbi:hypothetical protein NDU88_001147 [Pleurodeles waltl]|uniref:Uncharacterized protein n=1 Tax=Pleurodeles waltl TaxID=8319 RepID=A0AAV7V704_PLEWA|nr:hypothetical protein NDU88_001147 [Pleurodeles waltl]